MTTENKENDYRSLIKEFPLVFGRLSYIECGSGWYDLIRNCAEELNPIIENWYNKLPAEERKCAWCNLTELEHIKDIEGKECNKWRLRTPAASQIKSKFARLRWYTDYYVPEVSAVIDQYELISGKICEHCGAEGKERMGGWISIKCDKCYIGNRLRKTHI